MFGLHRLGLPDVRSGVAVLVRNRVVLSSWLLVGVGDRLVVDGHCWVQPKYIVQLQHVVALIL